jgi:hypothetical protein
VKQTINQSDEERTIVETRGTRLTSNGQSSWLARDPNELVTRDVLGLGRVDRFDDDVERAVVEWGALRGRRGNEALP